MQGLSVFITCRVKEGSIHASRHVFQILFAELNDLISSKFMTMFISNFHNIFR